MRTWLTEIGEPLPVTPGRRLMRVGLLAQSLAESGHDVTWWSSTFDHAAKTHRFDREGITLTLAANYRVRLLHARGYRANASFSRVRYHREIAAAFRGGAPHEPAPDLIYCCVPTLELTAAALDYGLGRGVPVVVDIRDLWPDVYLQAFPGPARPLVRLLLSGEFRRAQRAIGRASALVAVSQRYLEWGLHYAERARGPWDRVFGHGYARASGPGEDLARVRAKLDAAGVDPGRVICCFVGTFGRSYDLGPVIDAARRLEQAGDQRIQFVFAGEGERGNEWRGRAQGLRSVRFLGWISAVEIEALMRMAGVGLAAYAPEAPQGLPNKVFEYMSAGLPILSSLLGETDAFLREVGCGLTYAPGDETSFLRALETLIADPDARREMGRRGLEKYEAEFRADRLYRELVAHLERFVASRAAATPRLAMA